MTILITAETFLTEDYVSTLLTSGQWSGHGSCLDGWLSDCDEIPEEFAGAMLEDVKENVEFLKFFRDWLYLRFKFVMRYLTEDLENCDTLRRAIYLPREDKQLLSVGHSSDVGRYWTVSKNCVPYGAKETEGKELVIITTPLIIDNVDMIETIRSRMDYSHGDYEMEIYLKGAVTITAID